MEGQPVLGADLNCSERGGRRRPWSCKSAPQGRSVTARANVLTADLRLRSRSTGLSSQFHLTNPPNRRNKTLELDGLCIELIAPCGERFVPLTG